MPNFLHLFEIAVALGLIIFVHELGHFAAAKAFGVWVRRFAIGFGPPIIKFQRGETEYSFRAIPLGGFVEPMGDHPDSEGGSDPRALWRLAAWKRAVVFGAGVFMNGILAIVLFTTASLIGINVPAPEVGMVIPGLSADKAGLKPGDRIVSINGAAVKSFEDIMTYVMLSDAGTAFDVVVDRPEEGKSEPVRMNFPGIKSEASGMAPLLGIMPTMDPIVVEIVPGSPAEQAGLKAGDRVLQIAGRPITRYWQIDAQAVKAAKAGGPVPVVVERDGQRLELPIDPAAVKIYDLGMTAPVVITSVDPAGPAAKDGLKKGDLVVRSNDVAWPTMEQFRGTIKAAGAGGKVRLTIDRQGERLEIESAPAVFGTHTEPLMGVGMAEALGTAVVGAVYPGGPAAEAGILPGDVLTALGAAGADPAAADKNAAFLRPDSWEEAVKFVFAERGKPVLLRLKRGQQAAEITAKVSPRATPAGEKFLLGAAGGEGHYEALPPIGNPIVAMQHGLDRTTKWFLRTYATIRQLAKGQVRTKAVGGPVMIVRTSLAVAANGVGAFIDFWGVMSVAVAVFNFLPIPPFDGGHVLFVIIEKLKGGPITSKVRNWVWGVAWIGVLLLFVLVTYQDIAAWITR